MMLLHLALVQLPLPKEGARSTNIDFNDSPTAVAPEKIARAINAAIKAYSIAVTPSSLVIRFSKMCMNSSSKGVICKILLVVVHSFDN